MSDVPNLRPRVAAIAESATLAVDAKAKALRRRGSRSSGSAPASPTSRRPPTSSRPPSRPAATRRTTATRPPAGLPELRRRSPPRRCATRATRSDAGQVLVTNGGKHAIYRRLRHAARPGRRGAAPRAVLDDLPRADPPRRRRRRSSCRPTTDDRLQGHRRAARGGPHHRTKILVFVSPSNPTGRRLPADEVEAIGRWAVEHGIWVITDEIYEHLTYGDHEFSLDRHARARAGRPGASSSTAWPRPTP